MGRRRSAAEYNALIGTLVDSAGPTDAEWMAVGEGPGVDEADQGEPFVGLTGQEMRRYFDGNELPPFDEIYRANVYRIFGGKDYEFTDEDFERDEPLLLEALAEVQPKVIVAIGRHATRYFLGDVSMDEVHGLPWFLPVGSRAQDCLSQAADRARTRRARKTAGRGAVQHTGTAGEARVVVFPCYHPAAGFRSPEASALVSYDFAQLAIFARDVGGEGGLRPRVLHDDPIPKPQYFHVQSAKAIETFEALGVTRLREDSEGYLRDPWSIQFTARPGTGYMITEENKPLISTYFDYLVRNKVKATFHSALHDRSVRRAFARLCGWSEARILFELDTLPFDDTMVMAYLLQLEPQGLKGLATRHANMAMQSFDEMMGSAQQDKAMEWLQSMWDCSYFDYEQDQKEAFDETNRTPLRHKDGTVKTLARTGEVRYRKITKLPTLPKSDLFKAIERCMRAKEPFKLWGDQREDIRVEGYKVLADMPHARYTDVEFPKFLFYGCRDTDATTRVEPELEKRIDAMGLRSVYNLELGTYPLIDRMQTVGMKPDLKVFRKLSTKLDCEIADIQVRIEDSTQLVGFNANSGDQVAELLFHKLGLPPLKMTSGGKREPRESTNDKILEALEKEHGHEFPIISDIRDYRETYKLKHTFVDRVPDFVHRYPHDKRVHATFRTTRVITGRLAASDPNILAQPEHGKFAKDFKAGWVAEDGHLVCNWDLSQVELRILAHLSKDPVLCGAYLFECSHHKDWQGGKTICKRNECVLKGDLHARLAHMVFALNPDQQDDSKHRLPAKTHNFGLAMGMTCHGLMIELRKNGVEVDEEGAQEWIDASNKLYKKVPHYKDEKIAEARRNGLVRCLSGRIRYIGGIRSRDERLRAEAERFAFSTPIQEGAQMLMKQAETHIWEELLMKKYYKQGYYKGGSKGRWVEPLCQVHDALKFEVASGLQDQLNKEMTYAMTKVPTTLRVPLGVDGKFGPNFASMEKFGR